MEEANPQCEIKILESRSGSVWLRGVSGPYSFEALVFHTGSKYGIDKGRISKFDVWMRPDEQGRKRWVANYDRDWDNYPAKEHWQFVDNIIGRLEKMPQPEELKKNMCFTLY